MDGLNGIANNLSLHDCNMTFKNCSLGENTGIYQVSKQMPIFLVCGIIVTSVSGLVGNILAVIVVLKDKLSSISLLLCTIFISDCLILLGYLIFSAFDILTLFTERRFVVWYLECFIGISNACSALVGFERSVATLKPIYYRQFWKKKYTIRITFMFVTLNVGFEFGRQVYYVFAEKIDDFNVRIAEQTLRRFLPLICITTTNTLMAAGLQKALRLRKKMSNDSRSTTYVNELNLTKTSFILVLSNYFFMSPGTVTYLLVDIGLYTELQVIHVFQVAFTLHAINATMNFIIYALSSRHYRELYKTLLCCSWSTKNIQSETGYTICSENRTQQFSVSFSMFPERSKLYVIEQEMK